MKKTELSKLFDLELKPKYFIPQSIQMAYRYEDIFSVINVPVHESITLADYTYSNFSLDF